jgi:hypothetical protein
MDTILEHSFVRIMVSWKSLMLLGGYVILNHKEHNRKGMNWRLFTKLVQITKIVCFCIQHECMEELSLDNGINFITSMVVSLGRCDKESTSSVKFCVRRSGLV